VNIVVLTGPILNTQKDTSYAIIKGAEKRGHTVYHIHPGEITYNNGQFLFGETLTDKDIDCLFIRTDPPFDEHYLMNTWLLDQLTEKVFIINHPTGIRTVNEKIWATQFKDLVPPTLITRQKKEIIKFLDNHQTIILKPTNSYGGNAIFKLKKNDPNTNSLIELMTKTEVIAQPFLKESEKGDKRILLLDGEPLGAILRVHSPNDFRNNFFAGGHPEKTTITSRDNKIIQTLKPHLQKLGLHFVGIDIIGKYLIEVNVTSPTCLQEMNRAYNQTLEEKIINYIEKKLSMQVS